MIGRFWKGYDVKVKHKFSPEQREKIAHWVLGIGFFIACFLAFHEERHERQDIENKYEEYKKEMSSSEIMKQLNTLKKEMAQSEEKYALPQPKLNILNRRMEMQDDGISVVTVLVDVISKYAPNALYLIISASSMESADVTNRGVMISAERQLTPKMKEVMIQHPIGKYEIIIKTKEPLTVKIDHFFK